MPSGTKRRRAPSSDSNHTPLPNAKRRINSKELFRKFNRKQKAAKQARIQKEWEGEFENTNEQINKSYGVLGNNSSITGFPLSMLKSRLEFADTQFNGLGSVTEKLGQEIQMKHLIFNARSRTVDYCDLTASNALSKELMVYLPVIKELRKRGTKYSLQLAYDLAMQILRCSHIGPGSTIRTVPNRPIDKYNDRLLASILTERVEKEHKDRQTRHDAWNVMGKAVVVDADETLRNLALEERSLWEQELRYVMHDKQELEDRAEALKIQGVDKWYPKSQDAFMKAMMVKYRETTHTTDVKVVRPWNYTRYTT